MGNQEAESIKADQQNENGVPVFIVDYEYNMFLRIDRRREEKSGPVV